MRQFSYSKQCEHISAQGRVYLAIYYYYPIGIVNLAIRRYSISYYYTSMSVGIWPLRLWVQIFLCLFWLISHSPSSDPSLFTSLSASILYAYITLCAHVHTYVRPYVLVSMRDELLILLPHACSIHPTATKTFLHAAGNKGLRPLHAVAIWNLLRYWFFYERHFPISNRAYICVGLSFI